MFASSDLVTCGVCLYLSEKKDTIAIYKEYKTKAPQKDIINSSFMKDIIIQKAL